MFIKVLLNHHFVSEIRMPGQANITKFFRPIASSSVAGKNGSSKKETLENRSPNKSLNLETPEKISSEEEMKVKKRKSKCNLLLADKNECLMKGRCRSSQKLS